MDQDLRLLAGVAKPASVTVCEDSHGSPCVGGTLSSSDLAGKLFPVVPAGRPSPVGPVGLCGTQSPSDFEPVAGGPVGPYDPDCEPAGSVGPYVAGGPVGPYGTLSPFISGPVGPYVSGCPIGPDGTLSPFDSDPAGPVGPYVAGGPVGHFPGGTGYYPVAFRP